MHPAKGTLAGIPGNVALHQLGIEPVVREFFLAPGAREKTAFVWAEFQTDLKHAGYSRFAEFHHRWLDATCAAHPRSAFSVTAFYRQVRDQGDLGETGENIARVEHGFDLEISQSAQIGLGVQSARKDPL